MPVLPPKPALDKEIWNWKILEILDSGRRLKFLVRNLNIQNKNGHMYMNATKASKITDSDIRRETMKLRILLCAALLLLPVWAASAGVVLTTVHFQSTLQELFCAPFQINL
jgi:hypothetical protein